MLTFSYDALGRNLTQATPQGTIAYQYDLAGRRTRMTWPGTGLFVDYDHLVTGEVTKIRENGATSGVGLLATYAYDDLGRRISLTRGNGTTATYGYDGASRLAQLAENMAGTTHDLTLGFAYSPASQIVLNTRSNDLYRFNGQTIGATNSTVNGLNQVTTSGGATLAHDARGNMTNDGTKAYGYDLENMLISAPGATLAYDPALRLYQVSGAATTRFLYDGPDMIAEYDGSNALQRRFVHGPGADEPIVWYEGAGASDRRFLHADERGSVVAVSNSSGTVTSVNTYNEYGRPGAANVGRFQYTGQKWIAEVGLYDYKARMYNPTLGRFMQTDPIGYAGGMNLYAYVRNDAVNFTDPSGLCLATDRNMGPNFCLPPVELPGGTVTGNGGLSTITRIALESAFAPRGAPPAPRGTGRDTGGTRQLPDDPCNAPLPDGSTINRNVDRIKAMRASALATAPIFPLLSAGSLYGRWLNLVRPGGKWDYKIQSRRAEALGNMNYGATGSQILPMDILLRGAATVQDPNTPGQGKWYDLPGTGSDYGDQPADIPFIKQGAAQCKGS